MTAARNFPRSTYADGKYCNRDGICNGASQRSVDRNGSSTFCVHLDYQLQCSAAKEEDDS